MHVSACLDNAERVLTTVSEYCLTRRIAFKFLRSPDALLLANAKYTDRGSSGKFITIYPADEVALETLLIELGEMLNGSPGPYVLSDLRWRKGPLYVRYGGFRERYCLSETGSLVLAIEDPDGRLEPDRREPTFRLPVPAAFLDEAVPVIVGGPPADPPRAPFPLDPERDGWERIRASMAGVILASATPDRDDRLFPGDIAQFQTGGLNIAHGAAGVLYALDVTGAGRNADHEEWLRWRATHPASRTTRFGFYDGLHGVAYVLDHLGYRAEALKILDICAAELDGRWDRLGLDLYGGLAGIGLNLAHFAVITGDPALRSAAFEVARIVADRLGDEDAVGEVSGGSQPHAGLMYGSAGPALLFLRLYEQLGKPVLLDLARTALRQDLRRCVVRDDGAIEVNEGWRTMPYLADGSVGIGLVLDQYLAHRNDDQFAEAAAGIHRAAQSPFYIEPGLFHGRAGMVLHLSRGCAAPDFTVAEHIRRLAWHSIDYRGYTAFPGEELLRLSMDLATGTAGVLLAVGAALHPAPVHLPFLAPPPSDPAQAGSATPSIRRRR